MNLTKTGRTNEDGENLAWVKWSMVISHSLQTPHTPLHVSVSFIFTQKHTTMVGISCLLCIDLNPKLIIVGKNYPTRLTVYFLKNLKQAVSYNLLCFFESIIFITL